MWLQCAGDQIVFAVRNKDSIPQSLDVGEKKKSIMSKSESVWLIEEEMLRRNKKRSICSDDGKEKQIMKIQGRQTHWEAGIMGHW